MALRFTFTSNPKRLGRPDSLMHKANLLAEQAVDAKQSRVALEGELRQEVNHPLYQKILDATRGRRLIVYGGLTIVFGLMIYIEWAISYEIYAVLLEQMPWLLAGLCVAVGVYSSICIAETSNHFAFLSAGDLSDEESNSSATDSVISNLYERKIKRSMQTPWYFSPWMGLLTASLLLIGIYYASHLRVQLLRDAGNLSQGPESIMHQWLPVVLYAFEIIFGIPAAFFLISIYQFIRVKRETSSLTKIRDTELVLKNAAIRQYMDYLSALTDYNNWALQNQESECALLPTNQELRRLLRDELGHDTEHRDSDGAGTTVDDDPPNDMAGHGNAQQSSVTDDGFDSGTDEDQSRVDDLLNLVDEQINNANSSLN